ncbi:Rrf2 family transcriptional regulator [Sinomonas terrae]|uniref:Rrf2 family transcriptional regulator n=1 Tax=Sinomonas terrae TaxID=2908838 RepID=A0ABS9U6F4_9MICC|nr:Rrf2 family transcriptional regulator [Sinomonas terrae]MCH6472281.1 Rrf2 family transcriptional regulator [Sinomonas terrae]
MRIRAFDDLVLRVLAVLNSPEMDAQITTQTIAERVATPYNHVSKAITSLRQLGLIDARRGRNGGVRLTEAGRTATIGRVLRALDDREDVPDCRSSKGDCVLLAACGLRSALHCAREAFYQELDGVPIR